jgi:RNA polymerase sigma-70 factor (ECF subfamily)
MLGWSTLRDRFRESQEVLMNPPACSRVNFSRQNDGDVAVARERERSNLSAWIARVAAGDRDAFRDLYEATSAHLLGVAISLLNHRPQAEEVLQEAFVSVWKNAGGFDATLASPMTWLISIVRNRAIDLLRAHRLERAATEPLDGSEAGHVAAFEPLPEKLLQRAMEGARIKEGLQQMPRGQRQALALVLYRGMSYPEVAAAFGVPLPTVKSWVRRGVLHLREYLDAVPARR